MFRSMLIGIVCFVIPFTLLAGEPTKLRELNAKDLKVNFEKGRWNKPLTITNLEALDKAIPGADVIKKQVDFAKEKLLVFAWGGSGGDKLTGKLSEDSKTATFFYKGGLTRDFRRHVHVYVLPKDAEVKLSMAN